MHLEIVSFGAIQPNTGAAGVIFTGDSATVKNANPTKGVEIVAGWMTNQVAGFGQVIFPSGHDTTRGYRAGNAIGNNQILPIGEAIKVEPQELLSATIAGSNVAGDLEQMSFLVHYGDLPGINARLIDDGELARKTEKLTTIEQSITSVAGPGYSGEVVINTTTDLLMANRDYAVIGMSCRTLAHALTLRGPDLGNVRVGVPGVLRYEIAAQWFRMLTRAHNKPMIPVINSGNKASTFIGVAVDENAGTFLVTLYLALLK